MTQKNIATYTNLPADVRNALDRVAVEQRRTTSQQVAFIIKQWLMENGHYQRDKQADRHGD